MLFIVQVPIFYFILWLLFLWPLLCGYIYLDSVIVFCFSQDHRLGTLICDCILNSYTQKTPTSVPVFNLILEHLWLFLILTVNLMSPEIIIQPKELFCSTLCSYCLYHPLLSMTLCLECLSWLSSYQECVPPPISLCIHGFIYPGNGF